MTKIISFKEAIYKKMAPEIVENILEVPFL